MLGLLHSIARHGRLALVAGLLAGLVLPQVAAGLRPWLPQLVALLLFLTAIRIGPRAALGSLAEARRSLAIVLLFQLLMPLAALLVFLAFGVANHPFAFAVLLMLSAPSVTGAPNFAILMGQDPAAALRILIAGTALLPLTVLPVLWAAPMIDDPQAVLLAAVRLLSVIVLAAGLGFFAREWLLPDPDTKALDGLMAVALGVIVVGLMAALGPALRDAPLTVLAWLAGVTVVNFGLQIACHTLLRHRDHPAPVGPSIIAGNRNIALFLVALPATMTDPLLIFIGCYQIPMYLTPILMKRLYVPRHVPV